MRTKEESRKLKFIDLRDDIIEAITELKKRPPEETGIFENIGLIDGFVNIPLDNKQQYTGPLMEAPYVSCVLIIGESGRLYIFAVDFMLGLIKG